MTISRHYDTVSFDVRDRAAMLVFAETSDSGDVSSYLLLMRAISEDFDDTLYLELDEAQVSGDTMLDNAQLAGNRLTLALADGAASEFGDSEVVVTFDDNDRNRAGIAAGALRILGDKLTTDDE